jgi:hypothetical protein
MQRSITELKNRHKGQDIWVLGAGPSLNYVHPSFFENKICVGTNSICNHFPCEYAVFKDSLAVIAIKEKLQDVKVVVSRKMSGGAFMPEVKLPIEHYIFDHPLNKACNVDNIITMPPDVSCMGTDMLVVSNSTITSSIHLAAYLGAANIMICGHDSGTLEGIQYVLGYHNEEKRRLVLEGARRYKKMHGLREDLPSDSIVPVFDMKENFRWMSIIENQTLEVCSAITKHYGCSIHSLNPFINFNLEGHEFSPSSPGPFIERRMRVDDP